MSICDDKRLSIGSLMLATTDGAIHLLVRCIVNASTISRPSSRVRVAIEPTNEEWIAVSRAGCAPLTVKGSRYGS